MAFICILLAFEIDMPHQLTNFVLHNLYFKKQLIILLFIGLFTHLTIILYRKHKSCYTIGKLLQIFRRGVFYQLECNVSGSIV